MSIFKHLLPGVFVFALTACGGGGGGDGVNGEPVVNNPPPVSEPDPDPVVYNGVSSAAVLAGNNIAELIYNVFSEPSGETTVPAGSGDDTVIINGVEKRTALAVAGASKSKMTGGNSNFRIAAVSESPNASSPTSRKIDQVENCYRGTIAYTGELDSNDIGYVIADHNNCVLDNVRTSGRTRLDVYEYVPNSDIIASGKFDYKRLTTTYGVVDETSSGDFSTTISGTVDFKTNAEGASEEDVSNVVIQIDDTGEMIRFADFTKVTQYKLLSDQVPVSITMSGQVYDSHLGYIDVETLSPILMNPDEPDSPALAGQFRITGASGAQALITLLGGRMMFVQVDADGDDAYEQTAYFDSSKLLDHANGDITDSDGDGIPDRWEEQYGLYPKISDSGGDLDGDKVSNLDEYMRGTAPNNASLAPPIADLRLIRDPDADPFPSPGETTQLTFILQNNGPAAAGVTSVRLNLPDAFQLNATPPVYGGTCSSEGSSIFCLFENIDAGTTRQIVVEVTLPSDIDDYPVYGEIGSLAVNSDHANNEVKYLIGVRPPSAELTVTLSASPNPVAVENEVDYSIKVTNRGNTEAKNLVIVHTLPPSTTTIRLPSYCEQASNVVTCNFASLSGDGSSIYFSYPVKAPSAVGEINSSIIVSSDTLEFGDSDNQATQATEVGEAHADLYVEKKVVEGGLVGSNRNCSFVIHNKGPDGVYQAQLGIDMPPEVTPSLENATGASCSGASHVVCMATEFINNQSVTFPCTSLIPGIYDIPVTVTVTGPVVDNDPSNNNALISLFFGEPTDDIQSQINAAADNAAVTVPPGFYYGGLSYQDKIIRLVSSDGPGRTFFCGAESGSGVGSFRPGPEGEISGFTFSHASQTIIYLDNSNIGISNNVFENMISGQAVRISNTSNPVIERNIMRNNNCTAAAIHVGDLASSPVIANNLLENNSCEAVHLSGYIDMEGFPQVINNTIVNNNDGLVLGGDVRGVLKNNIIYGNFYGIEFWANKCDDVCDIFQSNLVINNENNWYRFPAIPDQAGMNGNISVDPLFVDPENSDYRLSVGSPAIDAGNAEGAPTDDLLGNPRPVDGDGTAEPDIGAYEFQ